MPELPALPNIPAVPEIPALPAGLNCAAARAAGNPVAADPGTPALDSDTLATDTAPSVTVLSRVKNAAASGLSLASCGRAGGSNGPAPSGAEAEEEAAVGGERVNGDSDDVRGVWSAGLAGGISSKASEVSRRLKATVAVGASCAATDLRMSPFPVGAFPYSRVVLPMCVDDVASCSRGQSPARARTCRQSVDATVCRRRARAHSGGDS